MKPSPVQRLKPIRHIADGRAQQSARRFVDSQRRVSEAEAKLQELRSYLQDYQASAGAMLDPQFLENRRAFIGRLREAERYQAGALERARGLSAGEREQWMRHRRELQVLDRLAALYRAQAHHSDTQRAQKLMDEFALRRYLQQTADEH